MKTNNMKHIHLLIFSFFGLYSFGQQSVNTAGGDVISSAQGTVSYSIGQISTNYISNGSNINEGVQQPYEFFNVLSIENVKLEKLFEVFPNPTAGIIHLKSKDLIDAGIEIFDESGRLILSEQHKNVLQSQIDLTSFARGVYSIKISGVSSTQIIKIIKN